MGQLQIPGTSIQYTNPKQVDQNSNVFPECGDSAAIAAGQRLAGVTGVRAGTPWSVNPLPGGANSTGVALQYPGPAVPQPGSFDPTPVTAPPILFNKQPDSLSSGGIQIPGTSGLVVKNPA